MSQLELDWFCPIRGRWEATHGGRTAGTIERRGENFVVHDVKGHPIGSFHTFIEAEGALAASAPGTRHRAQRRVLSRSIGWVFRR